MATRGDRYLATSGDFFMATDIDRRCCFCHPCAAVPRVLTSASRSISPVDFPEI